MVPFMDVVGWLRSRTPLAIVPHPGTEVAVGEGAACPRLWDWAAIPGVLGKSRDASHSHSSCWSLSAVSVKA